MFFSTKRYSWLSYTALTLSILLIVFLFILPTLPQVSWLMMMMRIFFLVGAPASVIISSIALFNSQEKKPLAIISLIISITFIILMIMFVFMPQVFAT
ncbi:hypothetical protein LC040_02425 [Bacillus tianshenii]|nr:hypothetical protein LC040_02425 [Bacillus tianshenii]